jgi:hypothetical protein
MQAARAGNKVIVQMLIDARAEPDLRDKVGYTFVFFRSCKLTPTMYFHVIAQRHRDATYPVPRYQTSATKLQ